MITKILSLLIRGFFIWGLGIIIGLSVNEVLPSRDYTDTNYGVVTIVLIWIAGAIFTLSNFHSPFKFLAQVHIEDRLNSLYRRKTERKTEDDMLRLKNLMDNGILTQDEYYKKINELKKGYL